MKKLSVILMALMICNACKKTPANFIITGTAPHYIGGDYKGSFERIYGDSGIAKPVTITFTNTTFTGNGDSSYYPAICNGTYSFVGDSVQFANQCPFAANFDWTYILKGRYNMIQSGDSLYLTHAYGDFIYEADIYKLKRQ